jgi:hypothetical protein
MKQLCMFALLLVGACYVPANSAQPMYAQPQPAEVQPAPQAVQPPPGYYGSEEQLDEHLSDDTIDYSIDPCAGVAAPPTSGSSASVSIRINGNGVSQTHCYSHSYNGVQTGDKCFNDKVSYCTSMCNENNPVSAQACQRECSAPPAPPAPPAAPAAPPMPMPNPNTI